MARDLFGAQRPQEPPPVRHMDTKMGTDAGVYSLGVDREKVLDAEAALAAIYGPPSEAVRPEAA